MALFYYQALERNGRKTKGMIEADSARHARQLLRGKELIPVHIEARMNTSSGGMLQRRRHAQKEYALELQRRRLTLHDIELELQKEAKKKTPQIRFSPFEPATPFTLRFYSAAQNACWAVKLAHDGALSLNQCDERMP
ncbi:hypothetical protein GRW79_15625 [Escherichia coli]|nr:hypothetical protein [Escherichia coli]MXH03928.1 hypothetical protein [Escherichia coli]